MFAQFLASLNSPLGDKKYFKKCDEWILSKSILASAQCAQLHKTINIKFDAINELNKSINNLLMNEANNFINQENQRLSFNSVNNFKSENKKIEEDVVDNILNDFTIEHPEESDHLFYPNTADKIKKQSQYEEEQTRKLDIVLN